MQLTKHPIFCFWYLVTFGDDKNTKISHNRSLHFSRQDGQDGKKQKKNHAAKVTKIPKTKIWDERNISFQIQPTCLFPEDGQTCLPIDEIFPCLCL